MDKYDWEEWRIDKSTKEENKSELQKLAHLSADDCARACDEHVDCFQWSYVNECCAMKTTFELGKPVKRPKEDKMSMPSGWPVTKIDRWVESQGECKEVSSLARD